MSFTTLLFDLDDTLYPRSTGLWAAIRRRMDTYLHDRLNVPEDEIIPLRERYYAEYGTTLRGLQADGIVDADDFLEYVHNLPLDEYLAPDPALRAVLKSLPQLCWVFTNADVNHAARVLSELDLTGCFSGIIDVRALDFIPKPDPRAFTRALHLAGVSDVRRCVFFDDSPQNLLCARNMGCFTVLVGQAENPGECSDRHLHDLHDLPQVFPELWATGPG